MEEKPEARSEVQKKCECRECLSEAELGQHVCQGCDDEHDDECCCNCIDCAMAPGEANVLHVHDRSSPDCRNPGGCMCFYHQAIRQGASKEKLDSMREIIQQECGVKKIPGGGRRRRSCCECEQGGTFADPWLQCAHCNHKAHADCLLWEVPRNACVHCGDETCRHQQSHTGCAGGRPALPLIVLGQEASLQTVDHPIRQDPLREQQPWLFL